MKVIAAIATGALVMTNPADAQTRPAIEHYGRPVQNGQPLPFSDAVRVGDTLYLSGQLGIGAAGKLPDGIEAQTKQALENIGAVLKRAGVGYQDVFHCTAMLSDMASPRFVFTDAIALLSRDSCCGWPLSFVPKKAKLALSIAEGKTAAWVPRLGRPCAAPRFALRRR